MNYDPKEFRNVVINQRNRLRMNKEVYAKMMGVSGVSVAKWENGETLPEGKKLLAILARDQKDGAGESPQPKPAQPTRQWLRFWVDGRPASFLEYQPGEEVHFRLATPAECASQNGCACCGGDPSAGVGAGGGGR